MARPWQGGAAGTGAVASAAALLFFTACGDAGPGEGMVVRDSAGIRIVEVPALPQAPLPWMLPAEPRVVIGGAAEDEASQLYQIAGAAMRSDGRIVVANGGSSELRLFEADGRPAGTFGRSGAGPGEFMALELVGLLPGDSAMVHDARQGRFTVVTPDIELGRTAPTTLARTGTPAVSGQAARISPVGLLEGGRVVAWGGGRVTGSPATGVMDPPAPLYLVGRDGAVMDSAGDFPRRPMYLELSEGGISLTRVPFGTETGVAVGGDRFHVATADAYEIRSFDPAGRLVRVLRAAMPRRKVTDADVARHMDRALEGAEERWRPNVRRAYEAMPVPDRMPAYGDIVADVGGGLWIENYRASGEGPPVWTVFDGDGRPLGTLTTPAGVQVLEIGEDYVLGSGADALDRPFVAVWGLERGGLRPTG